MPEAINFNDLVNTLNTSHGPDVARELKFSAAARAAAYRPAAFTPPHRETWERQKRLCEIYAKRVLNTDLLVDYNEHEISGISPNVPSLLEKALACKVGILVVERIEKAIYWANRFTWLMQHVDAARLARRQAEQKHAEQVRETANKLRQISDAMLATLPKSPEAPAPARTAKGAIVGYVCTHLGTAEIARQRRDLETYVLAAYSRRIDAIYVDERKPGSSMNAPSFRRLMTDADTGMIDVMVVIDVDHIATSRIFRNSLARLCGRLGIEVHTPEDGHLPPYLYPARETVELNGRPIFGLDRFHRRTFARRSRERGARAAARMPLT